MRIAAAGLALVVSVSAAPARAHEGGVHLKGTIERVDAAHLVLVAPDGERTDVALTRSTRIVRGAATIERTALVAGERAVVHAKKVGAALEATLVKVAASAPPATR